jgi:hypothetical protein
VLTIRAVLELASDNLFRIELARLGQRCANLAVNRLVNRSEIVVPSLSRDVREQMEFAQGTGAFIEFDKSFPRESERASVYCRNYGFFLACLAKCLQFPAQISRIIVRQRRT